MQWQLKFAEVSGAGLSAVRGQEPLITASGLKAGRTYDFKARRGRLPISSGDVQQCFAAVLKYTFGKGG